MLRTTVALCFVLIFVCAMPAAALITPVNPGSGGEPSLEGAGGILDTLYGWSNVSRIDDTLDQVWYLWGGTATAEAKFAGDRHKIGYTRDASGGVAVLSTTSGNGYAVTGSFAFNFGMNDDLRFNLLDVRSGDLWSSKMSENYLGEDHMVSYLVTGGANAGNYVIAWEDLPTGVPAADFDYNDMVIEFSRITSPVPEPTALVLLGLGFGLVGALGVARRKKA